MKRLLWVSFITKIMLGTVLAQDIDKGVLLGRVLGGKGELMPFVIVSIEGKRLGAQTDDKGTFRVEKVPFGKHKIVVSHTGYIRSEKTVELSAKSPEVKVDFLLKQNVKNLKEVVVHGKSKAVALKSMGYAVNVISVRDVKLQSVLANDLLDQSAGVRIRQSGGLGSSINYNINGLSGNSVRIFIDGVPMRNYGSSFSLSSIPVSMIDRIEVYKGVVPTYLSSDALGGAINIVLSNKARNSLNVSYSYGSFNTHSANVAGNYRHKKSGFTVEGNVFLNKTDNNYKVWGNEVYVANPSTGDITYVTAERFHDSYQSVGGNFGFGFTDVKWADKMLVGVVVSGLNKDIQHGATMETVYGNRRAEQTTTLFNATYTKKDLLKGLDASLFASYGNLREKVIDTIPYRYNWNGERATYRDGSYVTHPNGAETGEPTLNENREKNYTLRTNFQYKIGSHHTFGANYFLSDFARKPDDPLRTAAERELIDTRYATKNILGLTYSLSAFEERLLTSVFLKRYYQKIKLKDVARVGRSNAIEAYEYSRNTDKTGYGITLAYMLWRGFQIMASHEKAIRLPENQEIFGDVSDSIDPSYGLKPEESSNLNLGFNLGPFYFENHSIRANTNFFFRDVSGMIRKAVQTSALVETYQFENQDAILSKGVDIELRYDYQRKVSLTLGTSIFNARFNKQFDENGNEYIYFGDRLRNEPYFTTNGNVRFNLKNILQKKSNTSLYYNLSYVHEFFRDWESLGGSGKDVIPAQQVHSLGVAYTFPNRKLTLSFDIRNIFDEQVFDNWALQKPGRSFYVKANYTINKLTKTNN